jgi:putative PIN family toxin of toxin-antitoxin system
VRIVADTNVIVSAFLWGGVPRQLLDVAGAQRIELFTSRALIAELEEVLSREKLASQLSRTGFTAAYLLARYTQLATLVAPSPVSVQNLRDPADESVIACALAAAADLIVSGDHDLRVLNTYENIRIVSAAEALRIIATP